MSNRAKVRPSIPRQKFVGVGYKQTRDVIIGRDEAYPQEREAVDWLLQHMVTEGYEVHPVGWRSPPDDIIDGITLRRLRVTVEEVPYDTGSDASNSDSVC